MSLLGSQSGSKLSELEAKALEIIKSRGDEGIYQHELWKMLGIDSREGSRLAIRLLKKGLIVREPVVYGGRRTYRLMLAKPVTYTVKLDISLDLAIGIPCFTCSYLERCHPGGFYDPASCAKLNQWLDQLGRSSEGDSGLSTAIAVASSEANGKAKSNL